MSDKRVRGFTFSGLFFFNINNQSKIDLSSFSSSARYITRFKHAVGF
ncbi:Uncharacterised protein [Klebsiella oxytoca]|nr:Uncharacterised protein [Klebsiella oxytoca]